CFSDAGIGTPVLRLAWPDVFVEHASSVDYLRQKHGLTVERLVADLRRHLLQKAVETPAELAVV
ncbi:MAG: hypothetical protein ACKO3N_08400, partial [Verrucomicrobiota bacterium]